MKPIFRIVAAAAWMAMTAGPVRAAKTDFEFSFEIVQKGGDTVTGIMCGLMDHATDQPRKDKAAGWFVQMPLRHRPDNRRIGAISVTIMPFTRPSPLI